MAVCIGNIEKFLNDHPELSNDNRRKEIMDAARGKAEKGGIIASGNVKDILGNDSEQFFKEIETDFEHIQIGLRALPINLKTYFKKEV